MNKKCLYCYRELGKDDHADFHDYCSLKFFGTKQVPMFGYSLDQMAELAIDVVKRSVTIPGVQPKLSLTLVGDIIGNDKKSRLTVVGALGENYILKPPSNAYPELPQNEHLTMRIAAALDIPVVPSSLIRLQSGELSYITKRIDRTESGEKIHMLDMFQILEAFDKYKGSMEKIGKAIGTYSDNTLLDQLRFFELTIFSFLSGNNDMHLKNFSMINRENEWTLSPAYDLLNITIANPADAEELALPIEGKKKKINREHLDRFAGGLGLNNRQIEGVYKRFFNGKPVALEWINNSFMSAEYKKQYIQLLEERYARLGN